MAFPPPPPPPVVPPPPPPLVPQSKVTRASNPDEEVLYLIQPLLRTSDGESSSSVGDSSQGAKQVITFVHNISPVVQHGPMCGLVAISMASELLRSSKADGNWMTLDSACHPDTLLRVARERGLSKRGEMFSVDYMLEVAEHTRQGSCRGAVVSATSLDLRVIACSLIAGKAILVPYDADKDHTPCLARGHRAHWCVIVGFALTLDKTFTSDLPNLLECCDQCYPESSTTSYYALRKEHKNVFAERLVSWTSSCGSDSLLDCISVFVRHGKSRHMGLWCLRSLLHSNGCLVEVDPQRADPEGYVVPLGGIAEGLCSKALVLSP